MIILNNQPHLIIFMSFCLSSTNSFDLQFHSNNKGLVVKAPF